MIRCQLRRYRRSQGVQWVHLHPPGRWKKFFFRPNLQLICVSAPLQDTKYTPSQSKSQFLGVFARWLRFGGIFRRRRLKKVVIFFGKKSAPRRQNPGYAYVRRRLIVVVFWSSLSADSAVHYRFIHSIFSSSNFITHQTTVLFLADCKFHRMV